MTSRLNTLAATQRALLEKIQALDKQEAEEEAAIEELDEEDEAGREMAPADNEEDVLAMLMSKQRELQKMRSAITELQQLQSGVQDLLSGRPQLPQATASAPAEVGSDQYEQDFLEGLLRKRNELQRMQEALAGLTGSGGALEAQELEDIEEDFEEDFEEDEDDEAPTTQPAPAATTNELQAKEEMLAMLTAKHAELTRMRASIMELQQLQADEQAAALDDDEEEEEKDEEEEEELCRRAYTVALSALMKTSPVDFASCLPEVAERISALLATGKHKAMALYLGCNLVEHLGERSQPAWPAFMPEVFQVFDGKDFDARIPAAYAMNLAAPLPG